MRSILLQNTSPVGEYSKMLELTRERNAEYCKLHNFDFACTVSEPAHPVTDGGWEKIAMIQQAMQEGYDFIVWLDSDAMIYDKSVDLRNACNIGKIGACWHRIPQLHHWNVGVLYIHNTPETRKFIDEWYASYPAPKDGWFEQGVFNRMAMNCKTVVTLSDKWNATLNVSMVPDAVVLGFHGHGDDKQRLDAMTKTLEFINQKAQSG